jgi:hypothetical protein
MTRSLAPLLLSLVLFSTPRALAQSPSPALRIDVDLPSVGVALSTDDAPRMTLGVAIRAVARSGHGAYLAVLDSDDPQAMSPFLPSGPARDQRAIFDLAYVYRARLVGDDRVGLGLDLIGGASAMHLQHQLGGGLFGPSVSQHFDAPPGWYVGAVLGASIDVRLHAFVVGLDVRYHGELVAHADVPNDATRTDVHSMEAGLHVGFSFY